MGKTKDFDQFFNARKREAITFKIFGETFALKPVLPASVPLRLIRLEKAHGDMDAVPESEIMALSVDIFGQDLLDELCTKGLDIEQLGHLIKWAMAVYTGRDTEDPEETGDQGNMEGPQPQ